jgi:hypothetical protein
VNAVEVEFSYLDTSIFLPAYSFAFSDCSFVRRIQLGMSEEEWAKAVSEEKQRARMKMNSNKAKIYQRWLKKQQK